VYNPTTLIKESDRRVVVSLRGFLISYDSVTLTESLFWGIGIMALEHSEIPDMGVGDLESNG
jgi:hypothetical protein